MIIVKVRVCAGVRIGVAIFAIFLLVTSVPVVGMSPDLIYGCLHLFQLLLDVYFV